MPITEFQRISVIVIVTASQRSFPALPSALFFSSQDGEGRAGRETVDIRARMGSYPMLFDDLKGVLGISISHIVFFLSLGGLQVPVQSSTSPLQNPKRKTAY